MFGVGKFLLIALVLCTIGIDANRARRRRQVPMPNLGNAPPGSGPNPQILNGPGQAPMGQRGGPNEGPTAKQANRQYYSPYQGQYGGYGSIQGINYPYGGAGVGSYQYGMGQYGQYGSYYNQYPGSSSFYQNYGSGYRPNQYSSNYYPSSGSYYGGYFWNSSSKNHLNKCTLFLSSLFTLIIYVITK